MPLADSATTAVLTRLQAGVWTLLRSTPTPVEHGFDTLDAEWLADFRNVSKTALEVVAAFPQGMRFGSADFWLRAAIPERLGGNVWRMRAHYEGRISSGKPPSFRAQSTQEVLAIDNLGVTMPFYDGIPANVREANASVEIGYVLINASPPTGSVGLAGTPSLAVSVRLSTWSGAEAYRLNFPSGWIMTNLDVDTIAGASPVAHHCRETWQYFQEKVPV